MKDMKRESDLRNYYLPEKIVSIIIKFLSATLESPQILEKQIWTIIKLER
jgi:hypothetical protein